MPKLILKPGREKSLLRRHPWVFSGAVERIEGSAESGDTVAIHANHGEFLGWAAYSPQSQIVARVWDFDESARSMGPLLAIQVAARDRDAGHVADAHARRRCGWCTANRMACRASSSTAMRTCWCCS